MLDRQKGMLHSGNNNDKSFQPGTNENNNAINIKGVDFLIFLKSIRMIGIIKPSYLHRPEKNGILPCKQIIQVNGVSPFQSYIPEQEIR